MDYFRDKALLKNVIKDAFPQIISDIESDIDDLTIVPPLISFDKRLTLDMGDATIILEFVGGHSPGTILTYLVEDRAVFTGDNVEGQFPYFGQARFKAWKKTLRKLLSMDIEIVVPGHGPVGGREMVERYDTFFTNLEEEVHEFDRKGLTTEEMVHNSKVINFFPDEVNAKDDPRLSWIGEQYKFAAKAILAEQA